MADAAARSGLAEESYQQGADRRFRLGVDQELAGWRRTLRSGPRPARLHPSGAPSALGLGLPIALRRRPTLVGESVGLIAACITGQELGSASGRLAKRLLEFADLGRNGLFLRALSSVTNAVVDLKARLLSLPAWELLGGALTSEVQGYATGFYRREGDDFGPLIQEVTDRVNDGFRMLKLKGGFGIGRDAALVGAARRELGDEMRLALDVNRAYSEREATRLIREIEQYDVEWLEEPTSPTAVSTYARLRSRGLVPISAGESFSGRSEFLTFFEAGALDIAQPNVGVVGGLLEAQRVAAAAVPFMVEVVPHCWGTEVALAASLSLCVTLEQVPGRLVAPTQLLEIDCSPNPLREAFAELAWSRSRDVFSASDMEGLGVIVHADALDSIEGSRWSWGNLVRAGQMLGRRPTRVTSFRLVTPGVLGRASLPLLPCSED